MNILKTRAAQWLLLNVGAMLAYLWLASPLWVSAEHFGEPGSPGDAFLVVLVLWPLLGIFALFDTAALVVIAKQFASRKARPCALCTWTCVMLAWASVLLVDRLLAYNIIDARYS